MTKQWLQMEDKLFEKNARYIIMISRIYLFSDIYHMIDHADNVCDLALDINNKLRLDIPEKLIIAAAYLHDIFSNIRETHHLLSAQWVLDNRSNKILKDFTAKEIEMISFACKEHRASWKGSMYSSLSELISAADRGEPNTDVRLKRSYLYARSKLGKSIEASKQHAVDHIKEKYGRHIKHRAMYLSAFKQKLETEWKRLDNLEEFPEHIDLQ